MQFTFITMKTSLVLATITSSGQKFSMARSDDGREFFLGHQYGPMGFTTDVRGQVFLDYVTRQVPLSIGKRVLLCPGRKSDRGNYYTDGWGLESSAEEACRVHSAKPMFNVLQRARRVLESGRFSSWSKWEKVSSGIDLGLQDESRRDGLRVSKEDRFAPDYLAPGFHIQTRFVNLQKDNEDASDPRPFPPHTGGFFRVVRHIRGLPQREIVRGDAATISFEFPQEKSDIFKNGGSATYVWERFEGKNLQQEEIWTVCADPRIPQLVVEAIPLAEIDVTSLRDSMLGLRLVA